MTKQFAHSSIGDRRSSIVYSTSVGKAGLYTPADYIPCNEDDAFRDEDEEEEELAPVSSNAQHEYESLLDANNARTLQREAQQGMTEDEYEARRELIDEERDLLIDNKILEDRRGSGAGGAGYGAVESSSEVMNAWEQAIEMVRESLQVIRGKHRSWE